MKYSSRHPLIGLFVVAISLLTTCCYAILDGNGCVVGDIVNGTPYDPDVCPNYFAVTGGPTLTFEGCCRDQPWEQWSQWTEFFCQLDGNFVTVTHKYGDITDTTACGSC